MAYTNTTRKTVSFSSPKNPEIVIGSNFNIPSQGTFRRKLFTRQQFAGEPFFKHGADTSQVFLVGQNTYFLHTMQNINSSPASCPSFVSKESFSKTYRHLPSGFLTAQMSLMPRLISPDQNIVDNSYVDANEGEGDFNWDVDLTSDDKKGKSRSDFLSLTPEDSNRSVVVTRQKKSDNVILYLLPGDSNIPPAKIPDVDTRFIIGQGAFQIVLTMFDADVMSKATVSEGSPIPDDEGGKLIQASADNKILPGVDVMMGDFKISISLNGRCVGSFQSGEKNAESINLIQGTGEECIPQAKSASSSAKTFALTVYPLWNGVVIQSGVQTAGNIINASAAYVPIVKKASLWDCAEKKTRGDGLSLPFDPDDESEVFIKTKLKGKSLIPDLGGELSGISVVVKACSCKIAFAPLFFTKDMRLTHAISGNQDVKGYSYKYTSYPIWTDNDSPYVLNQPEFEYEDSGNPGPAEFTSVFANDPYLELFSRSAKYQRYAGEVFGTILRMEEEVTTPSSPSAQAYANNIPNWQDYITSVDLSLDLDSNSGTISFDKYGATGGNQDVDVLQDVGKITVSCTGAYNTNNKTDRDNDLSLLFAGYTWEAGDSKTPSGSDVRLSLIGIEKRLSDVYLVNPPIFDGYRFSEVVDFLCRTAGVAYDLGSADSSVRLAISTDPIETVIYNYSTGTEVKQALDAICRDTAHGYVPIDGKLVFFQRGADGKPNYTGKTWTGFSGFSISSKDANPQFENLRNQIILIGMRQLTQDAQKNFPKDFPVFPLTSMVRNQTTPDIPWKKGMCFTIPGYPTQEDLDKMADNIAKSASFYEELGSTTIPGANVKPLDVFMGHTVIGVGHNISLTDKSWTTTLNLQR